MAALPISLETTLDALRERAYRLEQEASALRSDLDEVTTLVTWEAERSVSPEALKRIVLNEGELAQYRALLDTEYPDATLRLVLQAHKLATRLKHAVPVSERNAAINAVLDALSQAAQAEGLAIPVELEAVVGD